MATGASGTITQTIQNGNLGTLILTVDWTQTYTLNGNSSTVSIDAKLQRQDTGSSIGGTWYANSAGGISVDGVQVVGWANNQSAGFTNPGQIGWQGSGSTTVSHTSSKAITISVSAVGWNHTNSYSAFAVPAKTEHVILHATSGLGLVTGPSGTITKTVNNSVLGDIVLTVDWTQYYTTGESSSYIAVNAKVQRQYEKSGVGGTWFAGSAGGISVDGVQVVGWEKDQSAGFTNQGQIGWQGSGIATVNYVTAKAVPIAVSTGRWYNTSNSYATFEFPASSDSVTLDAVPQLRTLSISQGTGSTVTVKRNGTALSSGATLYDGDKLVITAAASTGYNLGSLKVNGSAFTSGNTHTVSGNVTVATTASLKTYTLTISQATGSTVTVKKGTTTLASGATVTHGDTLTVTATANTGYSLSSLKVNGSAFTSGSTHTVSGAVSVATTASVKSFTLSISQGTGTTVTVKRTASPKAGAATGNLSSGAAVYYSDTLQISASAGSGYAVTALTVNGSSISSGGSHTVTGAVAVVSAAKQLGLAYIGGDKYLPYICIDGAYVQCQPYIGAADGSAWILQS